MGQVCTLRLRRKGGRTVGFAPEAKGSRGFQAWQWHLVPGFRKLPGFRGPIDLETWRLERRLWLQRPSSDGGACLMAKSTCQDSPAPSSGSRH